MRIAIAVVGFLLVAPVQAQIPMLVPPEYLAERYLAPINAPASIQIAAKDEPGERLVVTGQVVDVAEPIAGASIFVFHTDTNGKYAPGISGPDAELNPRLFGFLRTDSEGRYMFQTIRPGSYDGNPAHVHYVVVAAGYKPRIFDLWFQDDPILVKRRETGEPQIAQSMRNSPFYKAAPDGLAIRPVKRDANGVWHAVRNLDMIPE
jgi:protocatechuate 3,4-dioxygenase beta subunit